MKINCWPHCWPMIIGVILLGTAWPTIANLRTTLKLAHRYEITDDEALHTEVIEVFAQTGRYSIWQKNAFPLQYTTGPSVVLPAVALSKTMHISSIQAGRVWVVFCHALLLFFLAALAPKKPGQFLLAFFLTSGIFHLGWKGYADTQYYLYGILGEGVASALLVISLFGMTKNAWTLSGLAASLAFFAKPTFGIWTLMFLPILLFSNLPKTGFYLKTRALMAWGLPFIGWFTLCALQFGWEQTLRDILQYPEIMRAANGAGLSVIPWNQNLARHLEAMGTISSSYSIGFWILGLLSLFYQRLGTSQVRFGLGIFALTHTAWWFLWSPGIQTRYLLPSLVLGWSLFALACWSIIQEFTFVRLSRVKATFFLLLFMGLTFFPALADWKKTSQDLNQCPLCRQIALQDYWRNWSGSRPQLFSTTAGYTRDLAITLSAKTEVSNIRFDQKIHGIIVVGEHPKSETERWLKINTCKPLFLIPGRIEGFWNC